MKRFIIDIYQEADKNHHGIGKARGDVILYYQSGLKGVQVTSDKTQLFNAGNFIGQDGVNLNDVEFEEKNELGQVEFYSRKGTSFVFAPLSRERYPSTMNPDSADNWTRRDFQTEYKDVESLKAYALRTIKQYAYPLLTYTVDVQSSFLDNYKDINLGDTVKIIDNNFRGGLALEARVSEMIISFDNPTNNSVVFTNFRKLDNKPSSELQQRIDEIVSKSLPYHVEIRTTNGTVFKNGIGRSTVKPILKQGDKIVDATYRFVIDGSIVSSGLTYTVKASDITKPTVITISAWVDNKEVASEEVTFVNVSDGKQGPKGADGKTPYVHFAYADSADGQKGFSLTQTGTKRYLGVYTDFNPAGSTNPADYTWSDTAGSVSVGGDNLIVNSAFPKDLDGWGYWDENEANNNIHIDTHDFYYNNTKKLFRLDTNSDIGDPASTNRFPVKRNTDYSFNIITFATGNIKGVTIYFLGRKANETDKMYTQVVNIKSYTNSPSTTQAVKWHLTFNSGDSDEGYIRIDNSGTTDGKTSSLFFAELDCYEGTTDRAWQASPEDLKDEIDTKADDALTQAQLNKLSEINSVMKAELEAKASLATVNQWIKAYQDFVNANSADRAQAQKALADASARVVKLENNLNDMSERWNFIDNYMAASNDGLVIGKKDNSSSIMFNPNGRISMFSAGNEVMYISQGVIHIENGIFLRLFKLDDSEKNKILLIRIATSSAMQEVFNNG